MDQVKLNNTRRVFKTIHAKALLQVQKNNKHDADTIIGSSTQH